MGALQIGRSITPLQIKSIWCQFESDSIFKAIAKYTHARTRRDAKMGALRMLITEENNGSEDEFNPFNESLKLACFQRYI